MKLLPVMMPIAPGAALTGCATLHVTSGPPSETLDQARLRALYLDVIRKLNADGKSHAALAYLDDYDSRFSDDQSARLLRADCLLGAGLLQKEAGIYMTLAQEAAEWKALRWGKRCAVRVVQEGPGSIKKK